MVVIILRKVQHLMKVVEARVKGGDIPEELSLGQAIGKTIQSNKNYLRHNGNCSVVLIC